MTRYLLILLLLLPACSESEAWMSPVMISGGTPSGATEFCDNKSGSLACEDFEGSSACGDDANSNCRESWTAGGAETIDNQYAGIAGTYSKECDATAHASSFGYSIFSFSATNPVYAFAIINPKVVSLTGNTPVLLAIRTSTPAAVCILYTAESTGTKWRLGSSAASENAATGPSADTDYCVWMEYTNNTANTGCIVYIAEYSAGACSKPAALLDVTTGAVGSGEQLYIGSRDQVSFGDVDPVVFDNIHVKASAIGDSGE